MVAFEDEKAPVAAAPDTGAPGGGDDTRTTPHLARLDTRGDRRTQSEPDDLQASVLDQNPPPVPSGHRDSLPNNATSPVSPQAATTTTTTTAAPLNGASGMSKKKIRASAEFDRRFDGPFGRPSLSGTRPRRSSQFAGRTTSDNSLPTVPAAGESTAGDDGGLHGVVSPASPTGGAATAAEPPLELAPGARQLPAFQPVPPSLNYTLRTRIWTIAFFWTVIVFDSVVMPIALFFGLWYGVGPGNPDDERLSANAVFSVVTAAIGGASILEYFIRFWRLYKEDSTCSVIGARRWYLDWFHWWFSAAWIIIMIELIVGSVQHNPYEEPYVRLLSMPLATMLYTFGTVLLVMDAMHYFKVPAPMRISSIPKGSQLRPGIYPLIEDVCAVDGSGGTEFRVALDRRYAASHVFRSMLRRVGFFWAVGAEGCAVLTTALVCGLNSKDAAYVIGWSLPFVWAGIWAAATIVYVQRELKKEARLWTEEANKMRTEGSTSASVQV